MIFSTKQLGRTLPLLCLFIFINLTAFANVDLIKFPKTRQLYPRDLVTNKAVIPIQGFLFSTGDYDQLQVRVLREGALFSEQSSNVNFGSSSFMIFNYSVSIDAELANYTIQLVGKKNGVETVEASAEQVVAGDAYLINGQSNAQAFLSPDDSDLREFSRSYNSQFQWNYLNFSFPGLWGARLASKIVDEQQVPVAIFNGAIGAQPIATYLRNSQNLYDGNYGLLYQTLESAGLVGNIRAAFWFHGEADGWTTDMEQYIDWFEELNSNWQDDFNIENAYIYQIRSQSCAHPNGDIFEAHRQLAQNIESVEIMSTGNALHDSCHFEYEFGYRELGDRMFDLMSMNQYGVAFDEQLHAPDLDKAYRSGVAELTVQFTNTDSLEIIGWPWLDFSIGQDEAQIVDGEVQGNKVILQLSNDIDSLGTVSFRTHPGQANNFIVNPRGVAILSFYEAPLCTDCADIIDVTPPDNPGVATNELNQFVEKIYPNPVGEQLVIETSFDKSIAADIQIFNNLGVSVCQKSKHIQTGEQHIQLHLAQLPKGNYHLFIQTDDGNLVKRFVKL